VIRSKTDPGARAEPAKKKKMELASTRRPILLSRFDDNIAKKSNTVDTVRSQRKAATKSTWKRNIEIEVWTAGFRYSWRT